MSATALSCCGSGDPADERVCNDRVMDSDFKIQKLDERFHVLEAMQLAQRRAQDLARLMTESTAEQAIQQLCGEWDLNDGQAHAFLDLQVRRLSLDHAAQLADKVGFLVAERQRLLRGEPVD